MRALHSALMLCPLLSPTSATTPPVTWLLTISDGVQPVCELSSNDSARVWATPKPCSNLFEVPKPTLQAIYQDLAVTQNSMAPVEAAKTMSEMLVVLKEALCDNRFKLSVVGRDRRRATVAKWIFGRLLGDCFGDLEEQGFMCAGTATMGAEDENTEEVSGSSLYETWGFALDASELRRLGALWRELPNILKTVRAEEVGSPSLGTLTRSEEKALIDWKEDKIFRVGIFGKTGAGKSTLLNVLLRRLVSPMSHNICTGAVLELAYAVDQEFAKVFFRQPEARAQARDKQAKLVEDTKQEVEAKCKTEGEGGECTTAREKLTARTGNLTLMDEEEQRIVRLRELSEKRPLTELQQYLSSERENPLPDLVEKVVVHLKVPLLQYVRLLDTPGLSDPDEDRSRASTRALQEMDAVLYLVEAEAKENTAVMEEVRRLFEVNPRMTVFMAFSKLNMFITKQPLDVALDTLRQAYKLWTNSSAPIPGFNAKGPAEAMGLGDPMQNMQTRKLIVRGLEKGSYGLLFLSVLFADWQEDTDALDKLDDGYLKLLKEFLKEKRNSSKFGPLHELITDIQVEASNLPTFLASMRRHMQAEVMRTADRSKELLVQALSSRIDHASSQLQADQPERQEMEKLGGTFFRQRLEELREQRKGATAMQDRYHKMQSDTLAGYISISGDLQINAKSDVERAKADMMSNTRGILQLNGCFCLGWCDFTISVDLCYGFDRRVKDLLSNAVNLKLGNFLERLVQTDNALPGVTGNIHRKVREKFEGQFDPHRFVKDMRHIRKVDVDCLESWPVGRDRLQRVSEQSLGDRGNSFISMLSRKLAGWKSDLERILKEEHEHWSQQCTYLKSEIDRMENFEKRRVFLIDRVAQLEQDVDLFKSFLAKVLQVERFE